MTLLMNPDLLKHREVSTNSLNNLCTIIHKMPTEGVYAGQVYAGSNSLGKFTLTYNKNNNTAQVQIDMSAFDRFAQINRYKKPHDAPAKFEVGQDGIVIFFISGPQNNLFATLTDSTGKIAFDTRKLNKGDAAIFRLITQGDYLLTDGDRHSMTVVIKAAIKDKYPDLNQQDATVITLSAAGFSPDRAELNPFQGLALSIEVPATLSLTIRQDPLKKSKK